MRLIGSPVQTDNNGRYEIKALPQGRSFRMNISAGGYGRASCMADPPSNGKNLVESSPVQIFTANLQLGGIVVDDKNKPVRGTTITIYGENQPNIGAHSDRDGRFLFKEVCAGKIQYSANGADGLFASGNLVGGDTNVLIRLHDPGEPRDGVPLPRVSGVILDPNGNPAENVRIIIAPAARGEEKTDVKGQFIVIRDKEILGVELTEWVALASAPDRNLAASMELTEAVTNITLRLEPAWSLAGCVTDTDRKAIARAPVLLSFHTAQAGNSLREPVRTDDEGRYEFKGLAPGRSLSAGNYPSRIRL